MKTFVSCSILKAQVHGKSIENLPMNMALCSTFYRAEYTHRVGSIPSIKFEFGTAAINGYHEWLFASVSERDEEYKKILHSQAQ